MPRYASLCIPLALVLALESGFMFAADPEIQPSPAHPSFEPDARPFGRAVRAFMIPDTDFIAEGIAHDGDTGAYFVGGIHARSIVRVRLGEVRPFAGGGAGGLLAPFGMVADGRRRLLWVAHAGVPHMRGAAREDFGHSGIIAFDLDTGQVRRQALLDEPGDHLLADLVLARDGRLYASDSVGGRVYRFDTTRGSFEPLTAPGALEAPRGLALSRDGRQLYVADHARGLHVLDLGDMALVPVPAAGGEPLQGIHGLALHDEDLVAVQNGDRPHRVVRLRLAAGGRRVGAVTVLASALPEFEEPTRGVVVGSGFVFIANSQWNRFDEDHKLPAPSKLKNPVVLRVPLAAD